MNAAVDAATPELSARQREVESRAKAMIARVKTAAPNTLAGWEEGQIVQIIDSFDLSGESRGLLRGVVEDYNERSRKARGEAATETERRMREHAESMRNARLERWRKMPVGEKALFLAAEDASDEVRRVLLKLLNLVRQGDKINTTEPPESFERSAQ